MNEGDRIYKDPGDALHITTTSGDVDIYADPFDRAHRRIDKMPQATP